MCGPKPRRQLCARFVMQDAGAAWIFCTSVVSRSRTFRAFRSLPSRARPVHHPQPTMANPDRCVVSRYTRHARRRCLTYGSVARVAQTKIFEFCCIQPRTAWPQLPPSACQDKGTCTVPMCSVLTRYHCCMHSIFCKVWATPDVGRRVPPKANA